MRDSIKEKIQDIKIDASDTILSALKRMDQTYRRLLLVFENESFSNVLSIGDIQRAIIRNQSLETLVNNILRKETRIAHTGQSFDEIKNLMLKFRAECMPVVDENQQLADVYFWEDVFQEKEPQPKKQFNLPVVIMAGGFGTRLKPITNVLPKPLIPIGEKTILEHIFQRFSKHGCNSFHISVNYKAELIEYYLKNQNLPYQLNYFQEEKPMGTAGSLSLLKDKIKETFFVSNCDILIEQDYSEILDYHKTNKNDITIVAALKHYPIPYGTIETTKNGQLVGLQEKPELTFKINSGMYILEPHLLNEIPESQFFHITHLIEKIHQTGGNVGVFPVSEKSWKDIGSWDEYLDQL